MSKSLLAALVLGLLATSIPAAHAAHFTLQPLGTYASGTFNESAAEIVAYDAATQRAFVVNANDATVDVLDIADPTSPQRIAAIDVTGAAPSLGAANSVAVSNGTLAVAIERNPKQDNGVVAFYDTNSLALLNTVTVGALPDMLTFTPDGKTVVVANEGEPDDDYVVDPEGSISIIDVSTGVENASVRTAGFARFNKQRKQLIRRGVRVFGPGASVAQDLEPEYIAVGPNGRLAWVALQENNALAVVDLRKAKVLRILPLGTKDHSVAGNELDASNRDDSINIRSWPVVGMYQPDAIATYRVRGRNFIITANEGDARDYDGFSEETRVGDLALDPDAYPDAQALQADEQLGRLLSTTASGDPDGDGLVNQVHAYGARSFSIWTTQGKLVWDSGNAFESITANLLPEHFNSTNDDNDSFDNRSDDKGPEPEGVVIGKVAGEYLAFVGLERVGGIMVYNVTDPYAPYFESYVTTRDFSVEDVESDAAGDLGPEGLTFVSAEDSPNGSPLLIVGSEVSGTTTIFSVQQAQ
ncbi:MAG: choice-of-anchor I family protein [Pseudomonadota bacterium]